MRLVVFDTETTGLPKTKDPANRGPNNWPHLVSIAWTVMQDDEIVKQVYRVIIPDGWDIPIESTKIHGITPEFAKREGVPLSDAMSEFLSETADCWIAHNVEFDKNVIMNAMLWDLKLPFNGLTKTFCTMSASRGICKIPFLTGTGFKSPKLSELYNFILKKEPTSASLHNSLYDTQLLVEIIKHSTALRVMIGLPTAGVVQLENARPSTNSRILHIS
jgi:DNA polymerase-3 subunit alpha